MATEASTDVTPIVTQNVTQNRQTGTQRNRRNISKTITYKSESQFSSDPYRRSQHIQRVSYYLANPFYFAFRLRGTLGEQVRVK